MKHRIALLMALLFLSSGPGWSDDSSKRPELEKTLRKLEKEIAAVRGLEFKSPVKAQILSRPKSAAPKIQGYYNIKDKTLVVYDDISGNYERGVLIHEMVHALQDQHFGLAKLHENKFGSDSDLALAALIEGDATFTMIELLKKDQPRVAAMLDAPLEKARDVQNAFLYAQGARYVKALKEKGGWPTVNAMYKMPPRTTAAILHPEGVRTIDLGPGYSRGEFAIVKMLAANPATASRALQAAAGWRADILLEQEKSTAWTVAFATAKDAQEFHDAMYALHVPPNGSGNRLRSVGGWTVYQELTGPLFALRTRHERVQVLEAPDESALRKLLDQLDGLPPMIVYDARATAFLTFGQMIERLLDADFICVGEKHDSEPHHRVQYEILKGIFAYDERVGVGMEMFHRPFQPELDRYGRGEASEDQFLTATEYAKRWGFDWGLYRPIVDFCRHNALPVAALNAPREITGQISKVGYAGLSAADKEKLGPIDFQMKEHREHWIDKLAAMHGKSATAEQKERTYQVMTIWDDYMAQSAARFLTERGLRRLVVLAGSGHIDRGFGIPQRAAKYANGKSLTVQIVIGGDPAKAAAEAVTDFVVVVNPKKG